MCFRVELIGITDKLLFYRFGLQVVVRQWQILRNDIVESESGTGMTLADTCITFGQTLAAQHFCTADTMTNVRFCAIALNAGSIHTNDSDVVKHRCLLNELNVDVKFGM